MADVKNQLELFEDVEENEIIEESNISNFGRQNLTFDKCPGCKVYKGQYHHPGCKFKDNEQIQRT